MKKIITSILIISASMMILTGCLVVEKKVYKIELTSPTSGKATIKFVNLVSKKDEGRDVSLKDFAELVTDYYEGPKYEQDFPGARNLKKRLFEENGVLCSEVSFDFDSLSTVKLFKFDKDSPYMFYNSNMSNTEEIDVHNGIYESDKMPVLFWRKDIKQLTWTSFVQKDLTDCISLLDQFKAWEKSKK